MSQTSIRLATGDPKSGSALQPESGGNRGNADSHLSRVLDTLRAGVPNPNSAADLAAHRMNPRKAFNAETPRGEDAKDREMGMDTRD